MPFIDRDEFNWDSVAPTTLLQRSELAYVEIGYEALSSGEFIPYQADYTPIPSNLPVIEKGFRASRSVTQFTCLRAGIYNIVALVQLIHTNTNQARRSISLGLFLNGNLVFEQVNGHLRIAGSSGRENTAHLHFNIELIIGDTVEIQSRRGIDGPDPPLVGDGVLSYRTQINATPIV